MKTEGFWLSASGENHGNDSRPGDHWVTLSDLTGAEMIAMERQRQMAVEGWTPEHDDKHDRGQLISAAVCYAEVPLMRLTYKPEAAEDEITERMACLWPWDEEWWKPSDQAFRNLAKAGALIAAEIDRLQRLAGK